MGRRWRDSSFQKGDMKYVILDLLKEKPRHGYEIIRELEEVSCGTYKPSAGAVYPAVARLVRRGYLESTEARHGRRRRRTHRITRKGREALAHWLEPPLPEDAARITYDPIRTRAYFLGLLAPRGRREFLIDAHRQLKRQIPVIEAECERYCAAGDEFSAMAMSGALFVLRARLAWIAQMRRRLR